MGQILDLLLLPAVVSALIVYLTTPIIIKFANNLKIIDDPKKHKHPKVIHTYPVPRGGGIPLYLGILISALVFLPLDKHLLGILLGALLIVILGFIDDRKDLNPIPRLIVQFVAAGLPIVFGIGIAFITNPFNGILDLSHPQVILNILGDQKTLWILSDIFALLWLVTLMNFVNMGASGLDGQLSGMAVIAFGTIAALSLRYSADIAEWPVTILAAISMGAYIGFLPRHIYPQKIMPGFGGSTLAGFMLGVLSILSTTKVGTLMVVLAIPLIDTGYTIVRRILSGKSPVWGDRGHLHHKLLDSGMSKRQVAYFYWGLSALLGIIALNLNATYKLYTILGAATFIGGLLLLLTRRVNKFKK